MAQVVSAGYLIFRQSQQNPVEYLLLQHSDGKGHWTPPKGRLEKGETPLQAAERETKEEAGLDKNDLEYLSGFEEKITYDANGKVKDVYYYLARIRDIEKSVTLSDEHQNSIWVNLQDACNLLQHNETENALKKAEEFLKNSQK